MTPPPPLEFELTTSEAAELAREFTRVADNVDFGSIGSLLPSLSEDSGCYTRLLCYNRRYFKVYIGQTRSILRRVKDYGLDFQIHSPNDFKLRFFSSFMTSWWPGSTLNLHFAAYHDADLKGRERDLIRRFSPLINNLPAPSSDERTIVQDAFRRYYRSALVRLLETPKQHVESTGARP